MIAPRWIAEVTFRSSALGEITVDHAFEEIEALAGLIERGPGWNAIEKIVIRMNPERRAGYSTLEEAERQ